jgi:hypothetical protein
MKFSKIFKTTAVALAAVLALSGCIRETFPKESTITEGQLMSGQMEVVAENLLKGIPSSMMYVSLGSEHGDFGYHGMGVYNDQAAQLIVTSGWSKGNAPAYNRYYPAAWGRGYAENGYMASYAWYTYYPVIKNCNDVIKLVEGNDDLRAYSAIARTYRALFYLDLARLYECLYAEVENGTDYAAQQLLVEGLTVPIVSELTKEEDATNNPRATREEMFTFILSDLEYAAEVFSGDYTPSSVTDPTLAVVYGLYARAYMWLGGFTDGLNGELPEGNAAYQKAAEYARLAINEFGGAVLSEAEWTNPITGFNSKASSWMWGLYHSTDTVINNLFQFPAHMAPEADYGYGPLTHPGVSKLSYERLGNGDFRKRLMKGPDNSWENIAPVSLLSNADQYNAFADYTFFKFRPGQGNRTEYKTAGAVALPLMRCEEMYFIELEAMAHTQGNDVAMLALMDFIKTYRNPSYIIQTNDIVDEIIFQKGIEFWGEGLMIFDMKRLDMGVNTSFEGTNYDENRRFKTSGRIPWWTYCIPQGEIQMNTALKGLNNPDPSMTLKSAGSAQ